MLADREDGLKAHQSMRPLKIMMFHESDCWCSLYETFTLSTTRFLVLRKTSKVRSLEDSILFRLSIMEGQQNEFESRSILNGNLAPDCKCAHTRLRSFNLNPSTRSGRPSSRQRDSVKSVTYSSLDKHRVVFDDRTE